ncbi:hypothetical protein [Arthrobacter sp. NPDC090010]|uniref:hypothetical protein n=1 Tax=Arthrobacter sp. NPDC090010 TaxID=3363942 RepID=UPI0038209516
MSEQITVTIDRDSVHMGDDMRSHAREIRVEEGTSLSALLGEAAPEIQLAGWAWAAIVHGEPIAVWSLDHGVQLLVEDKYVTAARGPHGIHFRYVPGIEPGWLHRRLTEGSPADWDALERDYRPIAQASWEQEQRRLEQENPERLLTSECVAALHSLGGVGDLHNRRMYRFTLFGESWSVQRSDTMTLVYRGGGAPIASLRPADFAESWLVAAVAATWRIRNGLPPLPRFAPHPAPELQPLAGLPGDPPRWTTHGPLTVILADDAAVACFRIAVGRSVRDVLATTMPQPPAQQPSGTRFWSPNPAAC